MRVSVVVHPHAGRAASLVDEVRRWLGVEPGLVWSDDPVSRPLPIGGAEWIDLDVPAVGGLPPGVARVLAGARAYGLARACQDAARHDDVTLVLDGRDTAVTAAFDVPADVVAVIGRDVVLDGRSPTPADLVRAGRVSAAALSVPGRSAESIAGRLVAASSAGATGAALDAALAGHATGGLPAASLGWAPEGTAAPLVDLSSLDSAEPWRIGVGTGRPRFLLSEHPELTELVLSREPDPGRPTRLRGGVPVDRTMSVLVGEAVDRWRRGDGDLPPDPWRDAIGFIEWLEAPDRPWEPDVGRYWFCLWRGRPDLQATFPDPSGADLARFRDWADDRHLHEPGSPVLRSGGRCPLTVWADGGRSPGGIDLIGYFGTEVSLANLSRRMQSALAAASVPHTTNDFRRSGSPRLAEPPSTDEELRYDTVVAIVNPDQIPALLAEHGDVLRGRRLIGYWHWDVEHVPRRVADQMSHVEQIWVLNEWTERSLSAVPGSPPVRSLPVRVPEPEPSGATRRELGLPDDRFVFLVTLDHLSVTERKHPIGAIEAFRRAFPEPSDDGPVLVVKTMNADQRWVEHERLRLAALGRPDVTVVDRRLTLGDQMALIARADCLVSLHRSEGLGLHLVEAMWLGTPTIATRYSGNLSFMDDANALLVDAVMVPVERGEGLFPPEATWADPDLDQAAEHLRRMVTDAALRADLSAAGRRRMEEQPSFESTGRTIAAWCDIAT